MNVSHISGDSFLRVVIAYGNKSINYNLTTSLTPREST